MLNLTSWRIFIIVALKSDYSILLLTSVDYRSLCKLRFFWFIGCQVILDYIPDIFNILL